MSHVRMLKCNFKILKSVNRASLAAESLDRIDARGPARGEIGRDRGEENHEEGNGGKHRGIPCGAASSS